MSDANIPGGLTPHPQQPNIQPEQNQTAPMPQVPSNGAFIQQNPIPTSPIQQDFQPAPNFGAYASVPQQIPFDPNQNSPVQGPQSPSKNKWWLKNVTLKMWQLILTIFGSAVGGFIVIFLIIGIAVSASSTGTASDTSTEPPSSSSSSESDSSNPSKKPVTKKLESISAEYNGVTTPGTKIDDSNTDIKVTAFYSDGSTLDIDDWTVTDPGELQDGQTSTFTIEYKGKTTTLEITASQSEDSYKASAQDLSYDDLARNPDTHKGKVVHFKGEVIQVIEDNTLTQYRISVTSTDYGGWDDPIFVTFETDSNNRFLEDDIVEFWGTSVGTITYQSTMGGNITIPAVFARYMQLSQ